MQNAVFRLFPHVDVRYRFIDRRGTRWPPFFVDELRRQIDEICELKFAPGDIFFLKRECPFFSPTYLEWLEHFQFKREDVQVLADGDHLAGIEISGPWYRTILWEVPLMALISELYFKLSGLRRCDEETFQGKLMGKIRRLMELGVRYSDFGTRRRYSFDVQERVAWAHATSNWRTFLGTSNVLIAKRHGMTPIGTMAHEWIMFHAALVGYHRANEKAMRNWVEAYGGNLGIALTDTYTTDVFFSSFDGMEARIYQGLRHDSGSPIDFAERAIRFYEGDGIDPNEKTIVFSDGLDVDAVEEIEEFCAGRIQTAYGIGTNFSNDVGVQPLNMVIKMSHAKVRVGGEWIPTVKLSDVAGKHTGEKDEIKRCLATLGLKGVQDDSGER